FSSFLSLHETAVAFVFLFLLLLRHPTSTLFPYTTLFRSSVALRPRGSIAVIRRPRCSVAPVAAVFRQIFASGSPFHRPFESEDLDRKSTRLNSSHVASSYAVFCLKKKTVPSTLSIGHL